jgi:hypothetical protein
VLDGKGLRPRGGGRRRKLLIVAHGVASAVPPIAKALTTSNSATRSAVFTKDDIVGLTRLPHRNRKPVHHNMPKPS